MPLLRDAFAILPNAFVLTIAGLAFVGMKAVRYSPARAAGETSQAQRLQWYWPVFVAGYEAVHCLQLALSCRMPVSAQAAVNDVVLFIAVGAIAFPAATLAASLAESLAHRRLGLFRPPPAVLAACLTVAIDYALVIAMVSQFVGVDLRYAA